MKEEKEKINEENLDLEKEDLDEDDEKINQIEKDINEEELENEVEEKRDDKVILENENNKNQEVKKKKNNVLIIILCIVLACIIYSLPLIFSIYLVDKFDNMESKYQILDNMIVIEDGDIKVTDINGYYDSAEKQYIIYGYVNSEDENYLSVEFDLYDENGYIVGQTSTTLSLKKGNKYKFRAVYYDGNSSEVVNYKVSRVECY